MKVQTSDSLQKVSYLLPSSMSSPIPAPEELLEAPETEQDAPMQVSGGEEEEGEGDAVMAGISDDSSEEEEEDEAEAAAIRDGFIVDEEDDEDPEEEDEERRKRRKRRKKHHRKRMCAFRLVLETPKIRYISYRGRRNSGG